MAAKQIRRSLWLALICCGSGLLVIALYGSQFIGPGIFGRRLARNPAVATFYGYLRAVFPENLVSAENATNDWFVRHGKTAPVSDRLVSIGIDDASTSINQIDLQDFARASDPASADYRALELMSHPWPWSREVHALVLEKLMQAGAKVVFFDFVFQSQTASDPLFSEKLETYRDHVVVGSNFAQVTQPDGRQTWVQTMPGDSVIPQTRPVDDRVGYVNYTGNAWDGVVRSAVFRTTQEIFNGYPYRPEQETFLSVAGRTLAKAGFGGKIPADRAEHFIHFADPDADSLRPKPIYQLFVPRYWKGNFKEGAIFKDKIVVIGPYAEIMHDKVLTPFRPSLPGPHVHLQVINAVLENAFITPLPPVFCTLLIAAAALLAFGIGNYLRKPVPQFLALLAGSGFFLGLSWSCYNLAQIYSISIAPLLALNGGGIVSIIYLFVVEQLERARTRRTLERYVSRNVVGELLDNQKEFLEASMGRRKCVTVLFSDLRGFTSLTENADPQVLVVQLNEYLTEMVKCVFANQGTLDKFIGDAVMAVWGNVRSHGHAEDARLAITAALEMRVALKKLNAQWLAAGLKEFRFGIGLNHGEVITGDMGSPEKSEFTVIGDPINLASRMEGLTKNYGVDLLIGEDVAGLIADRFVLQSIDRVRVKGKGAPTEVFAVHQSAEAPVEEALGIYLERFATAMHLFRMGLFAEAEALFQQTGELHPDDPVTPVYLARCREYQANPPGADWDGIFTMQTK